MEGKVRVLLADSLQTNSIVRYLDSNRAMIESTFSFALIVGSPRRTTS
jgi:hypothetical protein